MAKPSPGQKKKGARALWRRCDRANRKRRGREGPPDGKSRVGLSGKSLTRSAAFKRKKTPEKGERGYSGTLIEGRKGKIAKWTEYQTKFLQKKVWEEKDQSD